MVEESEWLALLQQVMQMAGAVTDPMGMQGSSVMLCLEDGWDLTAQVSSIAQLCLDPFYRTIQVTIIRFQSFVFAVYCSGLCGFMSTLFRYCLV